MKHLSLAFCALLLGLGAAAQTQDEVLMTVNGEDIMASEFMYTYEKNNNSSTVDYKSLDEYLDLFVRFKLKVADAKAAGIDTTAAFLKELKGYRAKATPTYMKDEEAINGLIHTAYDRMQNDRRVAHIVLKCPADASDSLVEATMHRMDTIRQRVTTGLTTKTKIKGKWRTKHLPVEDFCKVADEVSEDPSVKEMHGELGWVTPFRLIYAFENAAYNTPVGQVSEPFRSPFGIHIALVEEERPHEEVKAAHIMKIVTRGDSVASQAAHHTMDSIYNLLLQGRDFAELASALSDDKGSASRGGDLGWFGRGMMVPAFENAVFSLQPGQISAPFESRFGWHIARMEGRRPIQPFDSIESKLRKQVQRDERMKEADRSFVEKTRREYNLPDTMSEQSVRAYADEHLEEKYPELKNLVREYHDGILLFDISLDKVWDRAGKDTTGLTRYFAEHRQDFTWDAPRYKGYVIYARDKASAAQAKAIIRHANPDSISSYISHRINNDSVKNVRVEHGLWVRGKSAAVDRYGFRAKEVEYTPDSVMPVVVPVGRVIKAPEEYTDERGKVISAYQDELEAQWIEQLRLLYPVHINTEVFERLKH